MPSKAHYLESMCLSGKFNKHAQQCYGLDQATFANRALVTVHTNPKINYSA